MRTTTFWAGLAVGVILAALIGFLILPLSGLLDTTATGHLNILDWWGETNLDNSLRWRASADRIPADADRATGLDHYRAMCLQCHGAPEAERQEWAHHMLPSPPEFWKDPDFKEMSDGEIFSIVKDGIRMTGMPAFGPLHKDDILWDLVAFVRHLDQITPEEKHQLQEAAAEFHHHEHEDGQ